MKKIIGKTLITLLLLIPLLGFGQGIPDLSDEEEITIIVSPENPKPGQIVSLRAVSNLSDLKNFRIIWRKDGIVEKNEDGDTLHKITVGNIGSVHNISVTAIDNNGVSIQGTVTIRPASVSLIWEADSYTPVFYKGKGLPSHQSEIKVIAIPNLVTSSGIRIGSGNLIYNWFLDGKIDNLQSGLGKNVFSFQGRLISRRMDVTLEVSSQGGTLSARELLGIDFIDPEIIFYKENPLTGIKGNFSLKTGLVQGEESAFIAEPYFFSEKSLNQGFLNYKWLVDNRVIEGLEGKRLVFSGEVPGRSSVSLEISNEQRLLQRAKSFLNVVVSSQN